MDVRVELCRKGPVSTTSIGDFYHVYEVLYGHSHQMTWMIPFTMFTKYFMVIHTIRRG